MTPEQLRQSIIWMTVEDLRNLILQIVGGALDRQQQRAEDEQRLPSKEAALFLGCTTGHLQKLHKSGLPYEKGKPNYYRLADLKECRKQWQIGHATS